MSNKTVNLAGKDLVVNSIKSMRGASEQEYMLSAVKGSTKRNTQTATASLTRLGARANASDSTSIDIYACDPRKAYSTNYGDSFYVDTAYASFNGLSFPVYIRTKKVTLSPDRNGTWAIVIKKVAGSEVWGVHIAFPSPVTAGGQTTMSWQEPGSVSFTIDDTTWIAGSFIYDSDITSPNYGVYGIVMHNEVLTPASFLKNRFMQIIGEAEGSDTDDFTSWAVAMGCDAIFKRLAALEAFVGRLNVNNVTVGSGTGEANTGFRFRAQTYDQYGVILTDPIFDVYFDDKMLFKVDPVSGKIYFGKGFWYDPADQAIHSVNDGVVIDGDDGSMTVNEGVYRSNLICPSFSSIPRETPVSPSVISMPSGAQAQFDALNAAGVFSVSGIRPCTHSGEASVVFAKVVSSSWTDMEMSFYGSDLSRVGYIRRTWNQYEGYVYRSTWSSSSFTLTIGSVSDDVFKLIDENGDLSIGTYDSSLEKGELYYEVDSGGSTGTIHIKLQ